MKFYYTKQKISSGLLTSLDLQLFSRFFKIEILISSSNTHFINQQPFIFSQTYFIYNLESSRTPTQQNQMDKTVDSHYLYKKPVVSLNVCEKYFT